MIIINYLICLLKIVYLILTVLLLNLAFGYGSECDGVGIDNKIEPTQSTAKPTTEETTTTKEITNTTKETTTEETTTEETTTTETTSTGTTTTETTTIETTTTETTTAETTTTETTTTETTTTETTTKKSCMPTTSSCTTEPTPILMRPDVLTLIRSSDCSSLDDGTILVDANHCRRYYICTSGRAKRHRCPSNHWYDRETLNCRLRNLVDNCPANRN